MIRQRWFAPLALILGASLVPLAQVAWDRAAARHATVTFSNRELPPGYLESDNSGTTLTWSWWWSSELDSVPLDQIQGLGLHCRRDDYDCGMSGKRRGWAVVGLDTHQWQLKVDSLQATIHEIRRLPASDTTAGRKLRDAVGELGQVVRDRSRLVLVAVGTDPDALAAQYNDGLHLILRARIHAYRTTWPRDTLPGETPHFRVYIDPLPRQLNVPARWAPMVQDSSEYHNRRYNVTIAVGGGWLPRVVNVEPFADPGSK